MPSLKRFLVSRNTSIISYFKTMVINVLSGAYLYIIYPTNKLNSTRTKPRANLQYKPISCQHWKSTKGILQTGDYGFPLWSILVLPWWCRNPFLGLLYRPTSDIRVLIFGSVRHCRSPCYTDVSERDKQKGTTNQRKGFPSKPFFVDWWRKLHQSLVLREVVCYYAPFFIQVVYLIAKSFKIMFHFKITQNNLNYLRVW